MPPEIAKLLWDMDDAAAKIERYSSGRTLADYTADDYFRSAVERQFATLGEAMTRLNKAAPQIACRITDHRKIRSFRNVIVHGYDVIDDVTTWSVIVTKLPALRLELRTLLAESSNDDVAP
jgi:uncharacterized protein with HEPN domain